MYPLKLNPIELSIQHSMKRKRNSLKSSQKIMVSSIKTRSQTMAARCYLPDECWEHVFKFILNDGDDENQHYLEPLSLVSKQFLSITNRLRISLTICDPTRPFLLRLFQRFPNLTSLDFTRFSKDGNLNALLSEISFSPFNNLNLKSLNLSNQYKFPANGLRDFSKKITTLTSLTCSNINHLRDHDVELIFSCFPFLEELNLSNSKLSGLVPNSYGNIDAAVNYMSIALPKLRKVNLFGFKIKHESSLLNLCKNCEFLEELIINCQFLTQDGIASAIRERPTLKSLSIMWRPIEINDHIISSNFIDSLMSLKILTCLDLSYSCISDELFSSIAMRGIPLRRLVLRSCNGYSYDGIFCLLSKYQCIQHLDLQNSQVLNDKHIVKLSKFLGVLVSINLSFCNMLTESSLFALAMNCASLNEINMTCIGKRSVNYSNSRRNLVVNPQLKSLHLAHNVCLRDEHINTFASIFPNLQFLDLSYCTGISKKGIDQVLRKCSKLKYLNLSASRIDDRSLYVISKSCFGLLELDLGRCIGVTKKGVQQVLENCKQLREINLNGCINVAADVVDVMIFIRPSLRKITAPPHYCRSESNRKLFLSLGCLLLTARVDFPHFF